jgi:GTP-binding protein
VDAPAPHLRVLSADYYKSGPTTDALGPAVAPEFAFIGRSNVGKSSLLNTLTKKANLVRTSRTPGQTRSVNLFIVEIGRVGRSGEVTEKRKLVLADLPGYGWAQMSKADRARLSRLLSHYISEREGLRGIVQLFDARHPASAQDVEVFREVAAHPAEHLLVATKADKLPPSKRKASLREVMKPLGIPTSGVLLFSSETGLGREELLLKIWELCAS